MSGPQTPELPLISLDTLRSELKRAGAESVEAVGKIVEEKLQSFKQAMLVEIATELRLPTRRTRFHPLDRRKMNVAGVIKGRPAYPKMTVAEIFREMDSLQDRYPGQKSYEPPWRVRLWSDMKDDNRARSYIAKIRAEPKYLPFDHLSEKGKQRFKMNQK